MTEHQSVTARSSRWAMVALIGHAFKVAPALSSLTALSVVVSGAAPVGITIGSGRLVNALAGAIGKGLSSPGAAASYRWVVAIAGLFFLGHVADSTRTAAGRALARKVTGSLAERVMASVSEPVTISHLEDPDYLARVARARGAGTIEVPPGEALFGVSAKAAAWITTAGSAALLAALNWVLGLVLFAIFAEISRRLARNYRASISETAGQAKQLRRAAYLRDVAVTPAAAKEVRVFGLMPFFRDAYRAEWLATMKHIWKKRHDLDGFVAVVSVIVGAAIGSTFWFLGFSVVRGGLTVGALTTGGLAARALLQLLNAGSDEIRISFGTKAAAEALSFPVVTPAESAGSWPVPMTQLSCIEVGFAYPGSATRALSDLDLSVPAGQSLAIVGLNGAGKTTLARLMAGLDQPSSGRLAVGGTVVDDSNRRLWQRQVAAVFQDFQRYELSVLDNITFGARAYADDRASVDEIVRQTGMDELVGRLPGGLDTVLSSGYPGGVDISGGEWQRVALARALFAVRHGARLLILDEPAASLDIRAEAWLYDTFHELTGGYTTIVISHRFATVRKAERVIVLDEGRVIEDGSHADLIADGGRYAELFNLQAKRFAESAT